MPRSPDLVSFVSNDDRTDYFTLVHARGVMILFIGVCINNQQMYNYVKVICYACEIIMQIHQTGLSIN